MLDKGLVYLIDDDEIQNIINTRIFELIRPGFSIRTFQDAADAISELQKTGMRPDLIFLDLNMPTTSGWEFLERFKDMAMDIPVVILTSSINGNDRQQAFEYECVLRYISKPVTRQFMLELVTELLK
ncbi:MAG: response regulator [Flavobacteriales bacterium]|nr:response regulator [Flavobacteriales bacterium]